MPSEVVSSSVAELVRADALLVEDGNHGEYRPLSHEFSDTGTPFIRPDDLVGGVVRFEGCDRINEVATKRVRKGKGKAGDILFTHRATVGRIARVSPSAPDFVANPGVTVWRVKDSSRICCDYLYYYMQCPAFMDQVWAMAGGTDTFPYISLTQQRTLQLQLPPLAEQRAVGATFAALDDRINLLRQTNTTLESIAGTLFKSWFIDFDPVRAKAEGREPEGMDAATAALFPAEFEESALGLIPKGWTVRSIDSFATYLNGLALQKYPPEGDDECLPVIKIAQLRAGNTVGADRASARLKPDYIVRDGDVLFSWSGSLEVEFWCGGAGALNQHLFKVTSDEVPKWFYYLATRHFLPGFREIAAHKATTMGHIQRKHLTESKVALPPPALLRELSGTIGALLERRVVNSLQGRKLADLRDSLLPRLISGKLRLPAAQAQAEAALA
jgi:type I restriction enzyme S subunit